MPYSPLRSSLVPLVALVAASAATVAAPLAAPPAAPVPDAPERPLLVFHGDAARPWTFAEDPARLAHLDGLPFSGFAYNLPATWHLMQPYEGVPFTEADMHAQFGGLDFAFQSLTRNWVSVVVRRRGATPAEGDFFNDAAWAATVEQFRRLARVARTPGYQCVGIVFDNEEYFEPVWNYPEDVARADLHELDAYREQARRRGREVMQAMLEEWPEVRVLVLHGPYRSTPEPRPFEVSMNQIADWTEQELDGPFFMGMAEVAEPKRVIDGGEVYQLRTRRQFAINTHWRRHELGLSEIVPEPLQGAWAEQVGTVHGLYDRTWPTPDDLMTPAIMTSALEQALRQGDEGTWLFIESSATWLDPGGLPGDWRAAIEAGIAAAAEPECAGDADDDGLVTTTDVVLVLAGWGDGGGFTTADRDLDGTVGSADLLAVLSAWGPCR